MSLAEEFPLAEFVPHSVPAGVRETVQQLAQKHADAMYNHLLLQLDAADRIANLSESQSKRLTVAAKGAVQHLIDQWITSIDSRFLAASQEAEANEAEDDVAGGADPPVLRPALRQQLLLQQRALAQAKARGAAEAQIQEAEMRQLLQAQALQARLGGRRFVVRQPGLRTVPSLDLQLDTSLVAKQKIWTATWNSTLTDRQRDQLVAHQQEILGRRKSSRSDHIVAAIDERLLLDASQRQTITVLVSSFLESPTIKNLLLRHRNLKPDVLTNMALQSFNASEMTEILSPAQRYQWNEMTRPRTRSQ